MGCLFFLLATLLAATVHSQVIEPEGGNWSDAPSSPADDNRTMDKSDVNEEDFVKSPGFIIGMVFTAIFLLGISVAIGVAVKKCCCRPPDQSAEGNNADRFRSYI
nr:expressed protein [Hymenolepis microstoma]